MTYFTYLDCPLGWLQISGSEEGISSISYVKDGIVEGLGKDVPDCLLQCIEELKEYFSGYRQVFSVKTVFLGSDFQKKVWEEMCKIPYGRTSTYLALAMKTGNRNAVRAVGAACKRNPIAIIGPCHRVIGTDGDLTGYFGGLDHKRELLMLENPLAFGKQVSLF